MKEDVKEGGLGSAFSEQHIYLLSRNNLLKLTIAFLKETAEHDTALTIQFSNHVRYLASRAE